ncbi:hypothetical protein KAR91_72860 [Candidatus Pacearchaeota archaeon]|nr:hypothetical protein [Candidatus Pacearchaeota archaeon]
MAVDYPNALPGVLVNQYSASEQSHTRSNAVISGAPRFQLLSDVMPFFASVAWSFDALEFQSFEAWFKLSTIYGAIAFNIDLNIGAGFVPHECYFTGNRPYVHSLVGKRIRVTASLVATEKQFNDDCDSEIMINLNCFVAPLCDGLTEFDEYITTLTTDFKNPIPLGTDYS